MAVRTNRRRRRGWGMTLAETSMALGIGVGVVAAAGYTYNAGKMSAGDTKARENISIIKAIAQELEQSGMIPTNSYSPNYWAIFAEYKKRRPLDWDKNPWGGSPNWWANYAPYWLVYWPGYSYGGDYRGSSWLGGNMLFLGNYSLNTYYVYTYDDSRSQWVYFNNWCFCYIKPGLNSVNSYGAPVFCDGPTVYWM